MVKRIEIEESNRVTDILAKLQKVDKKYEEVMLMSEGIVSGVPTISSGILSLDLVLGGGYPQGRIIEVAGEESSGKTTTTLHAIAGAQRLGGVGVFIDAEFSLDLNYAQKLGVDTSKMLLYQPNSGEKALDLICDIAPLLKAGDIIVVDSVAALTPQAEIDGEMGDQHMGLQARLMGQAMRKLTGLISKSGVTVIFLNQYRSKIGIIYGNPNVTTGGKALLFYASIRIDVKKTGQVKDGTNVIGNGIKFKTIKNKVFPPYREAETTIRYGRGIPRAIDVLTVASLVGIVDKAGAGWMSYGDIKLGQGLEKVADSIEETHPGLIDELEMKVLEKYNIKRS